MSNLSVFDIIGPVMIGPSSSHTAGAVRIGKIARDIFGEQPEEVLIYLHGSFGVVYKGHCTDRALVAGLLGMASDDERVRTAFEEAKKQNMEYRFEVRDLGPEYHPNTAYIKMRKGDQRMRIIGSSIGGGMVNIQSINGFTMHFAGDYSTMIIHHDHKSQITFKIVDILKTKELDVVEMKTTEPNHHNCAMTRIEMREHIPQALQDAINAIDGVQWSRAVNHISHFS